MCAALGVDLSGNLGAVRTNDDGLQVLIQVREAHANPKPYTLDPKP